MKPNWQLCYRYSGVNNQVIEQNKSEHIQIEVADIFSIGDQILQNTIVAVSSNQYESSRIPKSVLKNIDLCDLLQNNPETPQLASSSRIILDQIINENDKAHVEDSFR